jgi:hypothetical protein
MVMTGFKILYIMHALTRNACNSHSLIAVQIICFSRDVDSNVAWFTTVSIAIVNVYVLCKTCVILMSTY